MAKPLRGALSSMDRLRRSKTSPRREHAFPRLGAALNAKWPATFPDFVDFLDADTLERVLKFIAQFQSSETADAESVLIVSEAMHLDIIQLKKNVNFGPAHQEVLWFLQFFISTGCMALTAMTGLSHRTYDWILRSLVDVTPGPSNELVFDGRRVLSFGAAGNATMRACAEPMLCEWGKSFFYYDRKHGVFNEVGKALTIPLFMIAMKNLANQDARLASSMILSWVAKYSPDLAPHLVETYELSIDIGGFPRGARKEMEMTLITAVGRFAKVPIGTRAVRMLGEYSRELRAHERIQVVAATLVDQNESEFQGVDQLIGEVDRYRRSQVTRLGNKGHWLIRYDQARLFDILAPAVKFLLRSGRCSELAALFGSWVGAVNPRNDIGILAINDESGTLILLPTGAVPPSATTQSLGDLIAAQNRFLQTAIQRTDDPDFRLVAAERPGVPLRVHAEALRKQLQSHVDPQRLANGSLELLPRALTVTSSIMLPIQAIFQSEIGWCCPTTTSLEEPASDRAIRKVAIIGNALALAEQEMEAVRFFFARHDICVEHFDAADGRIAFQQAYTSDADVIWITSHGEFEHFAPHQSMIAIGDEAVGLDDLAELPRPQGSRRLLVLNVCDGASAFGHNGPPVIGLAVAAAAAEQAVISHLWPVETLPAAVFGAVLAAELAKGDGFFCAYQGALDRMRAGVAEIYEYFADSGAEELEICRRLRARTDWNFADWGSAAFYE